MRVRSWQMVTLILLLGIGYVCIFHWDFVKGLWEQAQKKGKGYGKAEKPEEAIKYLDKAMGAREYKYAKDYLARDYGNELGKIADEAQQLAEAIDNIRDAMKEHKIQGDAGIDNILAQYDTFPKGIELDGKIVQAGDNKAAARVVLTYALRPKLSGVDIALEREGEEWRILLPLNAAVQQQFAVIRKRGRAYAKAIEKVDEELKGRTYTADDVLKRLKEELTAADRGLEP